MLFCNKIVPAYHFISLSIKKANTLSMVLVIHDNISISNSLLVIVK